MIFLKSIFDLSTPSFLVDMDILEDNIKNMGDLCKINNKKLYPMIKTHKSTYIANLQKQYGAQGFLTGTIDEAQKLVDTGFEELMLAYPVAGKENIKRIVALGERAHLILSFDGIDVAKQLNELLEGTDLFFDYTIIVDSGLHRFGIQPIEASELAKKLSNFSHLKLVGISTHPGQVYGASNYAEVSEVAGVEISAMEKAKAVLENDGFNMDIIASGSTPTAEFAAKTSTINVLRPGNYVFYDNIQTALGVVKESSCSLTVLATIISQPKDDVFLVDAGSKCLGLDKGAHGISLVKGYGTVKGHKELLITDLSEEVAKIKIEGTTSLNVGDKIQIIPNHSCSSANMTNYLIGYRGTEICETILIDARGGSVKRI